MSTQLDEDTLALLAAYAEGELDGEEKTVLEGRIASEPAVAEELAAMRSLQASLHTMQRDEAPDDFARSVTHRIRRRSGGRFFRQDSDRQRLSVELFLAVAAVLFGLLAVVHTVDTVEILTDTPVAYPDAPPGPQDGSGAPSDGSGAGDPGSATPEPEEANVPDDGMGMPARDALREGVVSGGRYAGAVRRERVYVIRTELDATELGTVLRQRAGRDAVLPDPRGFAVIAAPSEVPAMVERLTPLGGVSIETVDIVPGAGQTPPRIVVLPRN